MASLRCLLFLLVAVVSLVTCIPVPGGGGGGHHTHFIIHVPQIIHKHTHTHVKKIHVPVVKTALLASPPIDHSWAHGGWYGSHIGSGGGHGGWW